MAHQQIIEGTREQLVKHIKQLPHTGRYKISVTLEEDETMNVESFEEPESNKTIEQFRKQGLQVLVTGEGRRGDRMQVDLLMEQDVVVTPSGQVQRVNAAPTRKAAAKADRTVSRS